jgi:signal transduction histidine kinase
MTPSGQPPSDADERSSRSLEPRSREAFERSRAVVLAAQERAQQAVDRTLRIREALLADREGLQAGHHEARRRLQLLQATINEGTQSAREKDRFLATVSHELRQPLNAALMALRMIEVEAESPSRAHTLLRRQLLQMARLVDDLLDMSRVTLNIMDLQLGHVDLARVLDDAIATIEPELESRELRLVHGDAPPAACVWGDESRLRQVFSNLLSNAVRYTPVGGKIALSARIERANAVVSVADTGRGIAAADLPRIFDPFGRGDDAHEGFGIGLSVVRGIVQLHRGFVRAESPGPGEGSTFTVILPLCGHMGVAQQSGSV